MKIQVKESCKGFLVGSHYHTAADGPFDVDDRKAHELLKQGLVDAVVVMPADVARTAINPKPNASKR